MKKCLLFLVLLSVNAAGQETTVDVPTPHPPALPPPVALEMAPRVGITSEVELSLSDAVRAVLANNRDVEVSRLARVKGQLGLRSAKGYFDPVFGGDGYSSRVVTPVASSLGGGINGAVTERKIYADPQISGNSPWLGTNYKLDFASARVDNNNTFNSLNPTYPTSATFNLTQPLWGGLLYDANRERLSVSKKNASQSEEQFKQRVIEVTTQAIRAYWELEYARRNLDVQLEAVHLVEQQDASNRRQVEQGTQAPVDVIQTQTQLSTYQQNVFIAQQQLTQAENNLKVLMLPNRSDPLWNVALKTSITTQDEGPVPTLDEALHGAFANRPDLKVGELAVQISEMDARLAREQAKPQFNLTAQLGTQGLAGRTVVQTTSPFGSILTDLFTRVDELSALAGLPLLPTGGTSTPIPSLFVGGYRDSLANLRDGRFPTVKIGLQVSLPIGNRTARAQAAIAEVNKKQSITQQQQLEMTVEGDVRNALQQLINTEFNFRAAKRGAELAQEQYNSEQRQFKAGTSSVFLVLQRQTELINAKLREIRATADHGEAQADFDRATAGTLTRQNIEIQATTRIRP